MSSPREPSRIDRDRTSAMLLEFSKLIEELRKERHLVDKAILVLEKISRRRQLSEGRRR